MDEDEPPENVQESASQEDAAATPSATRSRKLIIVIFGLLIVGALGAFLAIRLGGDPTYTITGGLALDLGGTFSGFSADEGDACNGAGGYSDIRPGAQVTVRDGTGATVAVSSLGGGARRSASCIFTFVVPDVPRVDFYSVEVSHRGQVQFSFDDMERQDWEVILTLG
jgi:hypothetical protein